MKNTFLYAGPALLFMVALALRPDDLMLAQLGHVAVGMFLFSALEDIAIHFHLMPALLTVAAAGVLHAVYVGAMVGAVGFVAGMVVLAMVMGIGMWRLSRCELPELT